MNHTAAADQINAELRDARDGHNGPCDAFDPCDHCEAGRTAAATHRHLARVEAVEAAPVAVRA